MSCANEPEFADPRAGDPLTLGELVYEVLHSNLSRAEQCGPTYGETLALDRERFVETFDHAISDDVVDDLPELLGGTILPVVDSGDLPALTEAVAEALALLIDDEFDPDRLTLQSALNVSQARTVLEGSHAIELMRRVLADPLLEERIHALAGLAQEPVGDDDVVGALLELAARNLEDVGEPSACGELEVPGLAEALLKTEGYEDDDGYGAPAWVVRADERGFPRVRRSDLDGRMPAPFVDGDRDGLADVDAEGRFVDGDGDPIAVEPFGRGEGYDADGRALAPDGGYLFEYVDVKQTTLGHVLQLGRDALEADLHHDLADVADAVLGDPQPCDDGPGCLAYPEDDHPIADAAFVLFEVARYERAKAFVDTIATLVEEDPELAEDLLVAIGQVIEALETTDLSLTDRELLDTGVELLPLMSRVFEADAGGESTPRVLLGVVDDLGDTARDFPEQLSYIVDYRDLEKPDACSPEPPDLARSTPVDWDMPRTYRMGGVDIDNRSALEQVIELLDVAHCGEVPFTGGQTVAYTALDLMADLEPNQVCNIIDLLLGAFDVLPGASDFVVSGALDLIGCDGDRVTAALRSLDALAQSGGLDFLLPVAKVFEERGQLDLLIEILQFVAEDLRLEEDGDPGTQSVVRRALPALSEILHSDAPDVLFDLLDQLQALEAADGDGSAADALVDAIAFVVDDSGTVQTRQGPVEGSSHARELLLPVRTLVDRIRTSRARPAFDRMVDHLTGYLTRTRNLGGRTVLEERNLLPLAQTLLEVGGDVIDRPDAEYQCFVGELQDGTTTLLTGRDLATVVRLAEVLERTADGATAEAWVRELLTPRPTAPDEELYGPILQMAGGLLGSEGVSADDATQLLRYLGAVARQRADDGGDLVAIVDRILASDENGAMLQIGRNFVSPGPLESGETPVETYASIFDSVTNVTPEGAAPMDPTDPMADPMVGPMCTVDDSLRFELADAEEALEGIVEFMQDDERGLGAIYALIGQRRDGPAARGGADAGE